MSTRILRAALRTGAIALASLMLLTAASLSALAHAVCGNRVFPATLTMDDPGVGDEFSFPTYQYVPIPAAGGNPSGRSVGYGYEWDKTITPHFGFAVEGGYITQRGAGQSNLNGWDNTTVTLKYELPCNAEHEFMMSLGVSREFAGTGSPQLRSAGVIDNISSTTPTIYMGKGLGDLPIGYLRPLAVTGDVGYQISDQPGASPDQWNYAASLQYSMPYLQQNVKALDVPEFFTRLIPLVEVAWSTPTGGPTTGTISPGVLYEADKWQLGAEVMFPMNDATRQMQGTAFIVQYHLFLDDILPNSLGRPIFSNDLFAAKPGPGH
jgi:hypothetical protein